MVRQKAVNLVQGHFKKSVFHIERVKDVFFEIGIERLAA